MEDQAHAGEQDQNHGMDHEAVGKTMGCGAVVDLDREAQEQMGRDLNCQAMAGIGRGAVADCGTMKDQYCGVVDDLVRGAVTKTMNREAVAGLDHRAMADCGTMEDLGHGAMAEPGGQKNCWVHFWLSSFL